MQIGRMITRRLDGHANSTKAERLRLLSGLLSGLVRTGANRPLENGNDDGILIALEVPEVDLAHVKISHGFRLRDWLGDHGRRRGPAGTAARFSIGGSQERCGWIAEGTRPRDTNVDAAVLRQFVAERNDEARGAARKPSVGWLTKLRSGPILSAASSLLPAPSSRLISQAACRLTTGQRLSCPATSGRVTGPPCAAKPTRASCWPTTRRRCACDGKVAANSNLGPVFVGLLGFGHGALAQ